MLGKTIKYERKYFSLIWLMNVIHHWRQHISLQQCTITSQQISDLADINMSKIIIANDHKNIKPIKTIAWDFISLKNNRTYNNLLLNKYEGKIGLSIFLQYHHIHALQLLCCLCLGCNYGVTIVHYCLSQYLLI